MIDLLGSTVSMHPFKGTSDSPSNYTSDSNLSDIGLRKVTYCTEEFCFRYNGTISPICIPWRVSPCMLSIFDILIPIFICNTLYIFLTVWQTGVP